MATPLEDKKYRYNAASVIYKGKILLTYRKQHLPNYGVFDEKRYFEAGNKLALCNIKNNKIAITICEDLWFKETMAQAKNAKAQLMISINASPFDIDKPLLREQVMQQRAREGKMPLIYVNCVGGQDELVFDGGSMVLDKRGNITQRAKFYTEELMIIELQTPSSSTYSQTKQCLTPLIKTFSPVPTLEELVYQALVLGVKDYIDKNNFPGAIVSISGGIDSALTLAIAVDAIGKKTCHHNLHAIAI